MLTTHVAPLTTAELAPTRSMFSRVVFGVDFGSASLAAARWAAQFIAPKADAIVSHVASPAAEDAADDFNESSSTRRLMPVLSGGLGGFAATLDAAMVRTVVRVGRPSHWLAAIASGAEAQLIVLGRRADANRKRIGEPNVIERMSRRSSCDVLVVPEGIAVAPRSIVAAVDDSAAASRVVRVARALARLHELPLTLLHVLAPPHFISDRKGPRADVRRPIWMRPGDEPAVMSPEASAWFDALASSPESSPREHTELTVGDAFREIISSGLAAGAPLIVAGMRGADGAVPGSLGSVVRELLTRAPVPVLAVNGA
jgi:nucleotide-binding universal stress UspA family protein